MLRMQILNTVYRTLRESNRPHTPAKLADVCDLTESQVRSALEYLEQRGLVTKTEEEYRAVPQTWDRVTPVVQFGAWVPRQILRPFFQGRNNR